MHLLNHVSSNFVPGSRVRATLALAAAAFVTVGCYHPVLVSAATPPGTPVAATAPRDSAGTAVRVPVPRACAGYVLLVENASADAVEIYEVGHHSDRFIVFAQIGLTEVPMMESTQQFVAISGGQLMASARNAENGVGERVALQRGCRLY